MADGTPQAEFNIPYHEAKGFPGLGVDFLRFPCKVPDRARCKHCNCIPKRIYHLLCPHHGLCLDCKRYCKGYYCDECCIHTTPEQLGAVRSDYNFDGLLLPVLCGVCDKEVLLGQLEEHVWEHTNEGRMEASKVQETTNQHEGVSEKPLRVSYAVSGRYHFCNENVRNNDYVEHLKMHTEERNYQGDSIVQGTPNQEHLKMQTEERNNQGDSIVQETPNQDAAMEVEETGSDETRPYTDYKEHSLDEEHRENCNEDPVICSRCCLFVKRNNMQKHTYMLCPERTIYCKRCHSSFPCSMEETHKPQCPKMERGCPYCGVNVLNENLQNHLDTECQERVVLCGACNRLMCYDERGDHDQECPETPVVCDECEDEMPRKEKSKHASECPMRPVCCENCERYYAYALKEIHRSECPKIERKCIDCGVNVLNENLQNHQDVECQKRVVLCDACKSAMSYDEHVDHEQECLEKPVVCGDCKGELLRKEQSKHASECPMRLVCCEKCKGFYAYFSEKEHRKHCETMKLACEYCKSELEGDDDEHYEKCDEDPVICSRCCLFVQRNNMQKHTYMLCPERTIYCKRCHSSFPCSMEETHKSQCPKMERECSDCGGNVLNENLQHHLDTECRKRVVRCGACNRLMCYDERDIHRSECPKIERKCIDCGINVLNENLQNHKEVECQKRVVLCDACKSAMYYDEHADHKQECLEKPVVCDDCKGEVLRKEKSKHVSECPMRNVGCENCKGFYAFSLEREHKEQCEIKKLACKYCKLEMKDDDEHHQTECQRPPELSKRGPIEKKSVPSVSLNAPVPPSPMGPQVASMKDHDSSSTKSCTDEEKKYCKFCERPVKKCNYEKHLEVCSKREEECGHCSLTVLREEWKTHEDICEKNPANIKPEPAPSVSKLGEKGKKHLTSDNKAKNSWPARQLLHSDKKAMDTIMELQQKIEEMERCNMALREEARSEKAKLVKIIQELENRQVEPNTFN